jgi:hypothetical protein
MQKTKQLPPLVLLVANMGNDNAQKQETTKTINWDISSFTAQNAK